MALTDQLTAIGNAIRTQTGGSSLIALDDMPTEILSISGDLPASAYTITGNCQYRFANNGWNWFIQTYGNDVTTSITNCNYMFKETTINIPFVIELDTNDASTLFANYKGTAIPNVSFVNSNKNVNLQNMFQGCTNIESFGTFTGTDLKPSSMNGTFESCNKITALPIDFLNSLDYTAINGASGSVSPKFLNNYNLRAIPKVLLSKFYNSPTSANNIHFKSMFMNCRCIDEIDGLNSASSVVYTANGFASTFTNTCRVKKVTFLTDENNNNAPFVRSWKGQTIDLTDAGRATIPSYITTDTKLTTATRVTDATSYEALKNDPDWWTTEVAYCRYNHDSAVETINSLPDTSAYIAQQGGTNTITFRGNAGSATDGGAINTLTAAEIAVATAKGWTVSLI